MLGSLSSRILLGAALAASAAGCGQRFSDPHTTGQRFALTNAHAVACTACHTDGTYGDLDEACGSCHEGDRPPDHHGTTDCGGCHVPTRWEDATIDHDRFFPTPHHGVSECVDCHPGGDTTDFTCTDCHEHSASHTNSEHHEVGNYVYESHACLDCHPSGREEEDD